MSGVHKSYKWCFQVFLVSGVNDGFILLKTGQDWFELVLQLHRQVPQAATAPQSTHRRCHSAWTGSGFWPVLHYTQLSSVGIRRKPPGGSGRLGQGWALPSLAVPTEESPRGVYLSAGF